jgi:beta-aspartyl-peptidase (threonine type)
MEIMDYVLAIHGGAGTILPGADEAPYHAALRSAIAAGEAVLAGGGSALDAVSRAVQELEDCILFNAGRGSVYTADAVQEMDAIVMDGANRKAGAVAGVCSVKNPVLLARAVMEQTDCVLLMGQGAERFARQQGFALMPPEYFASEARLAQLQRAQAAGRGALLDHDGAAQAGKAVDAAGQVATRAATQAATRTATEPLDPDTKYGTVGAVARDRFGNLASAVSTGGMTNKRPGRVGDTPIVGAGCYADNACVAVAATGSGEYFIRAVVAHDVAARMQYAGASLMDAAQAAIHDTLSGIGGDGGLIAIGHDGALAMPFNTTGMYRASVREHQAIVTAIFA